MDKVKSIKFVVPHRVSCTPFAVMEELIEVVATEVPIAEGIIIADIVAVSRPVASRSYASSSDRNCYLYR